jgi:hypothetical protein
VDPLIQASDLADFRGAPFSQPVAEAAAESIRTECEWHIAPSEIATVKLRGGGYVLLLPSMYVTDVSSVVDNYGQAVAGCEWFPNGTIECPSGFPLFVTVTFTHGYPACPPELLPVIAERAASQASGRIKSEAAGGVSISMEGGYDPIGSGVLAKYRLHGGT